jgi:hypothetical protein
MAMHEAQRAHLTATIAWADRISRELTPLREANADRVHFRPASGGFAMIGLLPERPQRGQRGLQSTAHVVKSFDRIFQKHCVDIEQGRITPEKALQSWLIRDAQAHGARLRAVSDASRATGAPVDLSFVTDEIAIPFEEGKVVCDLLALRTDGGRSTPVLIELKSSRALTRIVTQVNTYAALIETHADLFAQLYSALLDRPVHFDAPPEKWIIWPRAGELIDPKEDALRAHGIRVVGYEQAVDVFRFRVGEAAKLVPSLRPAML